MYNADLKSMARMFGSEVYAVLLAINCLAFGKHGYYLPYTNPSELAELLPDIPAKTIHKIVQAFVTYGFFDSRMFCDKRILTSVGMQRCFLRATARRGIATEKLPFLLTSYSPSGDEDFTPPTEKEVMAYCIDNGLDNVDVREFYRYYSLRNWAGKAKGTYIADWKAAARRWNKRQRKNEEMNEDEDYEYDEDFDNLSDEGKDERIQFEVMAKMEEERRGF